MPISDLVILVNHNISPSTANAVNQTKFIWIFPLYIIPIEMLNFTFCFSMWPISCDNFASIFTTPRNFRLWKTSSFAHQFGGAAFRNHHVARRFLINNIWRNDYFEECRLKMLMVYLCTFNGNWCKFFIDLYLHFHWICVHLKISLVKFEKGNILYFVPWNEAST